ncbi:MAG TPA: zf-HC2 domain-containing protein [Gaiellaceae bacterium]|jgi:predicted anti-sigma-YlaC factor YlaD
MLTPVPPTECTRAREAASARLDGELSELELAQLEVHLAGCLECAEYAALVAATTAQLRAADLVQPDEPMPVPRLRRRLRIVPAAAAAAVIAGVAASSFALGGALGSHGSQSRPSATTTQTLLRGGSVAQMPLVRPGEMPAEVRISSKVIAV